MSQIGKPPCDEALILLGGEATPCTPSSRRWVLAAATAGSSMAFLDGTVVTVALPAIQREAQRSKLAGAELPRDARDAPTLERVVKLSYLSGFRWIMLSSAVLALLSALTAWVSIGRGPLDGRS